MQTGAEGGRSRVWRAVLDRPWWHFALGLATVAVTVSLAASWLAGYRAFFVETPSMGQTAPVGSLVVVRAQDHYRVGDIITFQRPDRTYTHRIVGERSGGFITQGDLNGVPDAWTVQAPDVIGAVTIRAPGLGWLWRAFPWFLVGCLVSWMVSNLRDVPGNWVWPVRLAGLGTTVFALELWLRPWVNLAVLSQHQDGHKAAVVFHIVNTGVFPVEAQGTRFAAGHDVMVTVTKHDSHGYYHLTPHPSLGPWWTLAIVLACLFPVLIALIVRPRADAVPKHDAESDPIDPDLAQARVGTMLGVGWSSLAVLISAVGVVMVLALSGLVTL